MTRLVKALIAGIVLIAFALVLSPVFTSLPVSLTSAGRRAQGFQEVRIGDAVIPLLVADSETERQKGLSDRATTSPAAGMIFVFPEEGAYGIWMKDMRFALDIIWVSAEGVVVGLKENAHPGSFPEVFKPESVARYVIELPAGYAKDLKLRLGSLVEL